MRLIFTLTAFFLLIFSSSQLSAQIATYALTANGTPTTVDPNAGAINFTATGVGSVTYSVDGATANGWTTGGIDLGRYYQIGVSPNTGYDMNISSVNFTHRRSAQGPTAYQVRWSKDPTFATSTTIATGTLPNASALVADITGLNIDVFNGEDIYFRWYGYSAGNAGGTYRIQANTLVVNGTLTPVAGNTSVFFAATSASINEGAGTYNLNVSIADPSVSNATSVDVVLVSGNAARVNGFTSQSVVFPANTSGNQTVTLTVTDNGLCDGSENLVFELQNVSGGNSAGIVLPDEFTLSISDNDGASETAYESNFESGNLNGWKQESTGDWIASTSAPINGSYSLKHNLSGVSGESYASKSLSGLDLNNVQTTWRFQLANGNWDPNGTDKFWVYLSSSNSDLSPSSGANGYAVGVNISGTSDLITFDRMTNGNSVQTLISSAFDWNTNETVGVEITRNGSGNWELKLDSNGGFDALISAGTASDANYSIAEHFGLYFSYDAAQAGLLKMDDVSISQFGCFTTYYSQASGDMTDNIWDVVPSGIAGGAVFSRFNSFVLQNGHIVSLDANVEVNNLTINTGATFDLELGGNEIAVRGNWANSGSLISQEGNVKFIGISGTSGITGSNSFFGLEIDHSGNGVILNSNTNIWGTLLLTNGQLNVNGQILSLKSNANNTGAVGPVTDGSLNGDIRVERYIASGPTGWRNMGASVSGATLQQWNDHFTTTGFPGSNYPNWPSPANRFPSIKSYDETDLGDREIGWRAATSINNVIGDGQGFWMYLGGTELPATVDVSGSLITGEHTLNLDFTPDLGAYHDGWNLVSNMYAATIDWDSPEFERTGLEDGVWIWNSVFQQYGNYISGVGLNGVSNLIAHSQSFWVHADASSPTLTFKEGIKATNNNANWIKSTNASEQGILTLKIVGNGFQDETALVFNNEATMGYEGSHDAMKLYSPNDQVPSLATLVTNGDEQWDLSINSIPFVEEGNVQIPLKALAPVDGTYTLSVETFSGMAMSTCLVIEDLSNGSTITLAQGESIQLQLFAADSTARFMIHVAAPLQLVTENNTCPNASAGSAVAAGSGSGPFTYIWANEQGDVIRVSENVMGSDEITGLESGYYTVEIAGNNTPCELRSEAFTITAPAMPISNNLFEVSACNHEEGMISININDLEGSWNLTLLSEGDVIAEGQINAGEEFIFSGLSSALYEVQAENECGIMNWSFDLNDADAVHADFELSATEINLSEGGNVFLTNTSSNGQLFYWYISDGTEYYSQDVNHLFTEPGTYQIEMWAVGSVCDDVITKEVTVNDIVSSINENSDDLMIWYNGTEVIIENILSGDMNIQIHDILGKNILSTRTSQKRTVIPMGNKGYPTGIYFVTINLADKVKSKKILIGN
jgi:predicted secreted protein